MNKTVYEMIQESADSLKVDLSADELALFAENHELTSEHLEVTKELFNYLAKKKHDKTVETLLKQSRLPDKQPKTFENFDFTNLHGKQVERLSLSGHFQQSTRERIWHSSARRVLGRLILPWLSDMSAASRK